MKFTARLLIAHSMFRLWHYLFVEKSPVTGIQLCLHVNKDTLISLTILYMYIFQKFIIIIFVIIIIIIIIIKSIILKMFGSSVCMCVCPCASLCACARSPLCAPIDFTIQVRFQINNQINNNNWIKKTINEYLVNRKRKTKNFDVHKWNGNLCQ